MANSYTVAVLGAVVSWAASGCADTHTGPAPLVARELFLASPRPGVHVNAHTFYTSRSGTSLISCHGESTRSDTTDSIWQRFSSDNGRTWTPAVRVATSQPTARGTHRRYRRPGFVDPATGVLLTMVIEGTLPTDNPLEGMKHWTLRYELSRDGGHTVWHEGPVVENAPGYSAEHPLPGVWVGRNGIMIGDTTCIPIGLRNGAILVPVQICPVGPHGTYHNPGGGYTYHDAAVLIGRWNGSGRLDWRLSALVRGDPARSTRGVLEPTLAELPDGRVLMVLRGSNDRKPGLRGYRWHAFSRDGGVTWSEPQPWTYTDGEPFFSPSSCSQLLTHSTGRLYWIGNISPTNPRGNLPRYPLVIGEVDTRSGLLARESLRTIDDRGPDDTETLRLSNFYAREDRATRDILVHCSPYGRGGAVLNASATSRPAQRLLDSTGDAFLYRIRMMSGATAGR